ncbi:restriction endonuclease subunit S [Limosilactobacillus walteri]|uniref:Restriction endonuclease subunit S n=1 Tax=Limosilactobacillus walteri TaxID=2268022 RepID=A0ABR8P8S1_9LACO|nr:restriction endonuclease subunit S [Limosilactobacillus walteri]MBD5807088.1 restriction endonuclease subunit S [Limosilactobacillus walteri]
MGKSLSLLKDGTHGSYESVQQGAWLLSAKNIINNRVVITSNDRKISENDFKKIHDKFQLRKGDVLLTIVGTIGRSAILKEANKLTFQRSVAYLRPDENILTSSNFLFSLSKSSNFQNQLKKRTVISAQPGIYLSDIDKLNITIPELKEEQDKIASIIITIDNILSLQQRKLKQLKQFKKAMLQQLFVDKNNKQPILRFKNFNENWEQHKLYEVADYRNGKAHEQHIFMHGNYIVVNSKFVSTSGKKKKYSNKLIEPLMKNEIAFVLSDVPNGKALARTFLVKKSLKYSLNQRVAGITPHNNVNSYFLFILMNRNPYFLKFDNGVSQTNLSKKDVEQFSENYPTSCEQQKIGDIFKKLDFLITLQQNKLTQLTTLKKYLLQKLFI